MRHGLAWSGWARHGGARWGLAGPGKARHGKGNAAIIPIAAWMGLDGHGGVWTGEAR